RGILHRRRCLLWRTKRSRRGEADRGAQVREEDHYRDDLRAVFSSRGSVHAVHDAAAETLCLSLHSRVEIRRVYVGYPVITDGIGISRSAHVGLAPKRY